MRLLRSFQLVGLACLRAAISGSVTQRFLRAPTGLKAAELAEALKPLRFSHVSDCTYSVAEVSRAPSRLRLHCDELA